MRQIRRKQGPEWASQFVAKPENQIPNSGATVYSEVRPEMRTELMTMDEVKQQHFNALMAAPDQTVCELIRNHVNSYFGRISGLGDEDDMLHKKIPGIMEHLESGDFKEQEGLTPQIAGYTMLEYVHDKMGRPAVSYKADNDEAKARDPFIFNYYGPEKFNQIDTENRIVLFTQQEKEDLVNTYLTARFRDIQIGTHQTVDGKTGAEAIADAFDNYTLKNVKNDDNMHYDPETGVISMQVEIQALTQGKTLVGTRVTTSSEKGYVFIGDFEYLPTRMNVNRATGMLQFTANDDLTSIDNVKLIADADVLSGDLVDATDSTFMIYQNDDEHGQAPIVADGMRKDEYASLIQQSDREICEAMRAHFESHPTLPYESWMKDKANDILKKIESGKAPVFTDREYTVGRFAQTRIRDVGPVAVSADALDAVDKQRINRDSSSWYTYSFNATVEKSSEGVVGVYTELPENKGKLFLGELKSNVLKNNPMEVDSVDAVIQITDYSNGKMKNLEQAHVIVNTDKMSGDVFDLSADMLDSLNADDNLNK